MQFTPAEIQEIDEYLQEAPDVQVYGIKNPDGDFKISINVARQDLAEYVVSNHSITYPPLPQGYLTASE
jgi:hypothetical protein